jgi:SynChlorMet cassette radical SAM/SPASM protein ScmE
MTTNENLELIDQMSQIKIFTVRISGGEPFMREDILLIIESLVKKNIRVSINTNGMFITEGIARKLSRYKQRIEDIMVSIDGSTDETHDKLRGNGSFFRMIKGIKNLVDAGFRPSAYTTVNKYNMNDIEGIILLSKNLGISSVKFNELLPIGMGYKNFLELYVSGPERIKVLNKIKKLSIKYKNFISGTYLQLCELYSIQPSKNNDGYLSGCGATLQSITIMPDGTVVPCDRMQNFILGNVRKRTIVEIWRNSPGIKTFRKRFNKTLNHINECAECRYKNRCTGGCPAIPYYLKGNLLGWDPLSCYKVYSGEQPFPPPQPHHQHGVRVKNSFYF